VRPSHTIWVSMNLSEAVEGHRRERSVVFDGQVADN
jgi:hypothetical protein